MLPFGKCLNNSLDSTMAWFNPHLKKQANYFVTQILLSSVFVLRMPFLTLWQTHWSFLDPSFGEGNTSFHEIKANVSEARGQINYLSTFHCPACYDQTFRQIWPFSEARGEGGNQIAQHFFFLCRLSRILTNVTL